MQRAAEQAMTAGSRGVQEGSGEEEGEEVGGCLEELETTNRSACWMKTSACHSVHSSPGALKLCKRQDGSHWGVAEPSLLSQARRLHAEDKEICLFWVLCHCMEGDGHRKSEEDDSKQQCKNRAPGLFLEHAHARLHSTCVVSPSCR